MDESFHDATVTSFSTNDGAVRLSLEGVQSGDALTTAEIVVRDVEELFIDDSPVDSVSLELDDGEVLTLNVSPHQVELVVIWTDYANRVSRTRSYRVRGRSVEVSFGAT